MTDNLRVLLINLSTQYGGTDVRVLSQARALQMRVGRCAVAAIEGSELHQRLIAENLPHHTITHKRSSWRNFTTLTQLIREYDYYIVDTHNVQSIFWGQLAAFASGAAGRVVTVHSDYLNENPGIKGRVYNSVLQSSRIVVKQYIQVTEELQTLATKRGIHNSTWIPNAVQIPSEPLAQKKTVFYQGWGFAEDDFVVGIVGRLHSVKGHQYLIEALSYLQDVPAIKLLIVGDGDLHDALVQQVSDLSLTSRVHFAGFRRDIPDIMQSLDVLCIASLSEAHPYVSLEAASYARPIIATDVGGLKTLFQDSENGLLVESQNAIALADAIRTCYQNPAFGKQLGIAAYHMAKTQFSLETMANSILTVYQKALQDE